MCLFKAFKNVAKNNLGARIVKKNKKWVNFKKKCIKQKDR
jgi:hypothetical protein